MLAKYWRTLIINKESEYEYWLVYRPSALSTKAEAEHYVGTSGLIRDIIHLPHKKRIYSGFNKEEEERLEHIINATIERRRLMGIK